ncbi:uncharacterized protein LOC122511005 [Leptopilina heterotoma]|uniref:uncharacterized protein LOC122511005 n=1 Tax=Leptopilina heterotoma TaxID=63436 RepID=UPI001CA98F01|nr:uncharacterized protein LOC122511005 [Leptopilina heterotoma]
MSRRQNQDNFDSQASRGNMVDDEKNSRIDVEISEEARIIKRYFPQVSSSEIIAKLNKYRKASNRETIVLWELMPREKPEPIIREEIKETSREIEHCANSERIQPKRKSSPLRDLIKVENSASTSKKSRKSDESGEKLLATSSNVSDNIIHIWKDSLNLIDKYKKLNSTPSKRSTISTEVHDYFAAKTSPSTQNESSSPNLESTKPKNEPKPIQFYQMPSLFPTPSSSSSSSQQQNPIASTSSDSSLNPEKQSSPAETLHIASSSKTEVIPCKEIYYKLRGIFPDIDPAFITEKCLNPPFSTKDRDKEEQIQMFVDLLLIEGGDHISPGNRDEIDDAVNEDEQYENLIAIFPEADPEYLRTMAKVHQNNPIQLQEWIQKNLENPTYRTKAEYLKDIKINQQIKDYTSDFSVKKFLQVIPNPIERFENPERKCIFKNSANEFLKGHFRSHKVVTISKFYKKNLYNLTLTANDLRKISSDMRGRRGSYDAVTQDIPLLQEISYIKFQKDILIYIEELKKQEDEEFRNLKEQKALLECQCCFNEECLPKKCVTCEDGHVFCHTCVLRGCESKIGDGQNHINCFAECEREFSLSALQIVLPPTTFSILLQKRQEAEVMAAGLEGLVSCPFCHFASIPPPETKVFKCLNPDCMKETCMSCKALNHVPLKCEEVAKEDEARLQLEEKMTEALVRTCHKCQKAFFKEEGCNKMTCVCGASMCYLCSTPLKQGDYKHFNGQGSSDSNLCPLFSDDKRMNAEAVRKIAEITESELRKKNPNLKFSAASILPALPARISGPHNDIPNADALPEHVMRLANNRPN